MSSMQHAEDLGKALFDVFFMFHVCVGFLPIDLLRLPFRDDLYRGLKAIQAQSF